MIQKIKIQKHFLALVFLAGIFVFFMAPQQAFAAIKTWAGANPGDQWSDGNNWTPAGAPSNNDDIIFNCATTDECTSVFDIPGLIVSSITFEGLAAAIVTNPTNAPLTITGDISSDIPGTHVAASLILGANITTTNITLEDVDLNGNALTITGKGELDTITNKSLIGVEGEISGDGILNIDADPDQEVYLSGPNTYSGTTNVNGGMFVSNNQHAVNRTIDMFGVSDVHVGPMGKVVFWFNETESGYSFENTLSFTSTNPQYVQLEVGSDATDSSVVEIGFPNIILNSNTRFASAEPSEDILVDLTGITANSYCIDFDPTITNGAVFFNAPQCGTDIDDQPLTGPIGIATDNDDAIPTGVGVTGSPKDSITTPIMAVGTVSLLFAFWRARQFFS